MRGKAFQRGLVSLLASVLGIGLVWELVRVMISPPAELFPPLKVILASLIEAFGSGKLGIQVLFSLGMIAAGLGAGILIAMLLVFLAELHPLLGAGVSRIAGILHPLPGIALLPVVILWFGIGIPAVLVIIIHSVLWPLTENLKSGVENMSESYRLVAENFGFGRIERLFRVILPAAFPFLLAGFKIAWARAWRALISAEMVFGAVAYSGGLGWFIFSRRVFMDTAGIFAGLTVVVLIGLAVEQGVIRPLERRTVERWGMR
jgi:NitT/TauT family transport system permease protein